MNIEYNPDFWLSPHANYDVASTVAMVNRLHLFLRTENVVVPTLPSVHNFHCLYLCIKGAGSIEIDGVPFFIKAGEAIGIPPHRPHRRMPGKEEVHYLLLRFTISNPELISNLSGNILTVPEKAESLISKLLECYQNAIENASASANNETLLYATLLINALSDSPRASNLKPTSLPERLNKALQMLSNPENINLPLHIIAHKLGITPGHLSDLIRDHLGYPPSRLRRAVIVRTAVHYLTHTDLNISEIAELSGFKNVYSFSRFFKQAHGISPRKFRSLLADDASGTPRSNRKI